MANEDKKTGGNQDSVLGEIIIYVVLIIILLLFLLQIIDRIEVPKTDQKTENPQASSDTLGSVEKKLNEMADSVTQTIKDMGTENADRILEQLKEITGYAKANQKTIPETDIRKIKEELELFRKNQESYPKLISEKLDRMIVLMENQKDSNVIYSYVPQAGSKKRNPGAGKNLPAPRAKAQPVKQISADIKNPEVKQAAPKISVEKEEIKPVFTVSESIMNSEEIQKSILMENGGITGKTLCKNKKDKTDTVHFLSNQVLVRLVSVYPPDGWNAGSAMIDITHPRLGLRRFSEMEEGTTRPFEYGRKIYFLELLKLHADCADVAVYERKSS